MESSFLFHYMGGHGHRVGSVCVGVDNAITGAFDACPEESMERTISVAVGALARLK